uniref:ZP domain-containing protein n=1 Tax=Syphacia muris TaxID=451379 RepID=A0A0N5AHX9_9BILA
MYKALCVMLFVVSASGINIPEKFASKTISSPAAQCTFTVHKGGPNGPTISGARPQLMHVVSGTNLYSELYYKITCEKENGYCLHVSNCTVSGDGTNQKPYQVIDENGCTTEPSLFEHVQYESDFTAGIYNPLPVRFRGTSGAVNFFCTTTLVAVNSDGKCERKMCTWNEYSRKANES